MTTDIETLQAEIRELEGLLTAYDQTAKEARDKYIHLARLVVEWYTAPMDYGYSEQTEALQKKAAQLAVLPEILW